MRFLLFTILLLLLQSCHYYKLKSFNLVNVDACEVVKKNTERKGHKPVTIIHQEKDGEHYRFFLKDMIIDSISISGIMGHYLYSDTVYCENREISEYYYNAERKMLKERERKLFNTELLDKGSRRMPIEDREVVEQTHIYLKENVSIVPEKLIKISQEDIKALHIQYWSTRGIGHLLSVTLLPAGGFIGLLAILSYNLF